jgi:hypothetical protein
MTTLAMAGVVRIQVTWAWQGHARAAEVKASARPLVITVSSRNRALAHAREMLAVIFLIDRGKVSIAKQRSLVPVQANGFYRRRRGGCFLTTLAGAASRATGLRPMALQVRGQRVRRNLDRTSDQPAATRARHEQPDRIAQSDGDNQKNNQVLHGQLPVKYNATRYVMNDAT